MKEKKLISIVTPCFNEEDNVDFHYKSVTAVTDTLAAKYDFELIYTDNSSTDLTFFKLQKLASTAPNVKVIRFSRNIGPNKAIYQGLCHASGDAAIMLQADLQDPVSIIPDFLQGFEKGYDVVYGEIVGRDESFLMQYLRNFFYYVVNKLSEFQPPKNAGEFRLMSRRVLEAIRCYKEDDLYLRGIIAHIGFDSLAIPYKRDKRLYGETKMNYFRLTQYALNAIVSTTAAPMRLVIFIGLSTSFIGLLFGIFLVYAKVNNPEIIPQGLTTLMCMIIFFFGVNFLCIGLIGEYIRKIFFQTLNRPQCFIKDKVNFND